MNTADQTPPPLETRIFPARPDTRPTFEQCILLRAEEDVALAHSLLFRAINGMKTAADLAHMTPEAADTFMTLQGSCGALALVLQNREFAAIKETGIHA